MFGRKRSKGLVEQQPLVRPVINRLFKERCIFPIANVFTTTKSQSRIGAISHGSPQVGIDLTHITRPAANDGGEDVVHDVFCVTRVAQNHQRISEQSTAEAIVELTGITAISSPPHRVSVWTDKWDGFVYDQPGVFALPRKQLSAR